MGFYKSLVISFATHPRPVQNRNYYEFSEFFRVFSVIPGQFFWPRISWIITNELRGAKVVFLRRPCERQGCLLGLPR